MPPDSEIQINLLGFRLRISGPAAEVGPLQSSLYTQCQEPPEAEPDAAYRLEVERESLRVLDVEGGDELLYETRDRSDLYWWLESALVAGGLKRAEGYLLLHGAAVERGGKAIVLLGESYAGKSTLTMHLIQSGFRLISDEVVLVDPASLRLRAFPRNLLIREKALLAIQDNERFFEDRWHYEDDKGEIKWMMDPAEIGGSVMAGEAEVGEIFWLQREEGPPLLEAAGMRAVVEMMVKHGMNLKELGVVDRPPVRRRDGAR